MPSDTSFNPIPPRSKFRVRFAKAGDLRFVSHHDLMHLFERMFRRADLHLATSQGFNPRPKMTFALSLALGIAGRNEVLEVELVQHLSAEELHARLTRQCPHGLTIHSVRPLESGRSACVRRAIYALDLPIFCEERLVTSESRLVALAARCGVFLAKDECWVQRARPQPRRVNVRPFVDELRVDQDRLTMALWITPNGAARPEEVLAALGLVDPIEAGGVIERVDLEIIDEMPPGVPGPPVIEAALESTPSSDAPAHAAPRPTAIVGNPLSFDA